MVAGRSAKPTICCACLSTTSHTFIKLLQLHTFEPRMIQRVKYVTVKHQNNAERNEENKISFKRIRAKKGPKMIFHRASSESHFEVFPNGLQ
jgi:hypothetical protein